MADLTPAQRDALTQALHDVRQGVQVRLADFAGTMWDNLGDWRDDDVDRFVSAVVPRVEAGKTAIAQATDAYVAAMIDAEPVGVADLSDLRNGATPEEVYRRPAIAMRSAIAEGADFTDALNAGARRLASIVKTDLQLAHTHQARESMTEPAPRGRRGRRRPRGSAEAFRRVPSGSENCALCLIASTQRYWVGDLLPIHPGCDCGVQPLGPGEHVDQVIDRDLLEAVHDQVEGIAGFADRGGREVDYRQLIVSVNHGEHGPSIRWKHQKAEGPGGVTLHKALEPVKAPEPEPEPEPEPVYSMPGGPAWLTTTNPPVDWLSSGLTAADLAEFDEQDLRDLLDEAAEVNDPRAYELANAELAKRARQAEGYRGTGYTRAELRAQYDEYIERTYWEAEAATNGQLLTREARANGVTARSLFTGNERTAYANATDDLKYYWQANPRLTFEAFIGNAEAIAASGRTEF